MNVPTLEVFLGGFGLFGLIIGVRWLVAQVLDAKDRGWAFFPSKSGDAPKVYRERNPILFWYSALFLPMFWVFLGCVAVYLMIRGLRGTDGIVSP